MERKFRFGRESQPKERVIKLANEEKKDFNAMLHNPKNMPKIQIVTDKKTIEIYGGNKMYFAPPIDYDSVFHKFCTRLGKGYRIFVTKVL